MRSGDEGGSASSRSRRHREDELRSPVGTRAGWLASGAGDLAASYNGASSLVLFCPITRRTKGYPFEVPLPGGLLVSGVILVDQLRSLDWRARSASLVARAPDAVVQDVLARLAPLVT